MYSITKSFVLIQVALIVVCQATVSEPQQTAASGIPAAANPAPDQKTLAHTSHQAPASETHNQISTGSASTGAYTNTNASGGGLEGRTYDRNFIKDIVDRLHALDSDIGKLLFNSTSMYAPNDQASVFQDSLPKGGERMTEVLADLDSLQDEIGGLISNATRTRQYNILIRLRPLNTILYRIRHNLNLMRNSLAAVSTVASLERLGNSVLDSSLSVFLQPDVNANEEFGDDGNYAIDLNKPLNANSTTEVVAAELPKSVTPTPSSTTSTTTTTSTTLNTTISTTPKPSNTTTTAPSTTSTDKPTTSRRPTTRPPNRRAGNRTTQRRNSTTSSTTTAPQKPSTLPSARD